MKLSPKQREALNLVADGKIVPSLVKEEDGWHARWRAVGTSGENDWIDSYVREFTMSRLSEDAEDQKHETLHDAWMLALRSRTGLVVWDDAECTAFARELEEWSGNAEDDVAARREVVFSFLTSGKDSASPLSVSPSKWRSGILSASPFSVSCEVPKGRRGLRALGQAAYVWSPLVGLKLNTEAQRHGDSFENPVSPCLCVKINRSEAEDFLRRGARELRDAGYRVEGVDLAAEIAASAEVDAGTQGRETGGGRR